ncbi:MAG: hypothetical protein R2867_42495 [Caldilineaceae bacterium]
MKEHALMGLTVVAERNRLVILNARCDCRRRWSIGCRYRLPVQPHRSTAHWHTMLTTIGLVSCGIYQLIAAVTAQLP